MPEGHVVHRIAQDVSVRLGGGPVDVSSPQGRFADEAALLDGTVLLGAEAAGKHLFLDFADDRYVHIHLGLIGKLRLVEAGRPPVLPETLRLRVSGGVTALELRGPQWCRLVGPAARAAVLAGLGPDPLRPDADPSRGWAKVRAGERPIGALLMDQTVAAGVGNIYRAEVLFRQGVSPFTPGDRLTRRQWDALWNDLVEQMNQGVREARIDTVRLEHTPLATGREPRRDPHGGEVYVYRRAGQACLVCGTAVRTQLLQGRHLYWCARCQRSRR